MSQSEEKSINVIPSEEHKFLKNYNLKGPKKPVGHY